MPKYYLGIDIGDGETSVAVLTEQAVAPLTVDLGYRNRSILSAVGTRPDGAPVIGEDVLLQSDIKDRRVRFKSKYLKGGANEDIIRFSKGLAAALRQFSGLYAEGNELFYAVGCPTGAGWTDDRRHAYADLVRMALPVPEMPVGESRAAFLYTNYSGSLGVSPKLLKGSVLVVDMGSSTTDLAYVVAGRDETKTMAEFGEEFLGGGMIDQALLRHCVAANSKAQEIEALFEREPSVRSNCEVTARQVKEEYFTALKEGRTYSGKRWEDLYYGKSAATYVTLKVTATKEMMDQILNEPLPDSGLSYVQTLDRLLEKAVEKTASAPPALIILTGGASRMGFVGERIAAHFPNATICPCPEPEFSIAKGLAFACRVDDRMKHFLAAINDLTEKVEFDRELDQALPGLVERLCSAIVPCYVDEVFLPAARIAGLGEGLEQALAQRNAPFFASEKLRAAVNGQLAEWMKSAMPNLKAQIMRILGEYSVDKSAMPVPQAADVKLQMPPIPVNFVVQVLMTIPGVGDLVAGMMRKHYISSAEKRLREDMLSRSGTFYMDFRNVLKQCIKQEVDRRAKAVQIPIV